MLPDHTLTHTKHTHTLAQASLAASLSFARVCSHSFVAYHQDLMEVAKPSATMKKRKPVPRTPVPMNAEEKSIAFLDLAEHVLKRIRRNPDLKPSDIQRVVFILEKAKHYAEEIHTARTMPKAASVHPLPPSKRKEPFL